jgi:alcohol dehydrogenase class IV
MMRCLPEAYAQSHQVESREKLMFAQQLVSMASSNVMANMVCKLAGQIESLTHIPMGNAVAALLPNVIESLKNKIPEKIQMMAEAILAGDNTLEHGPDHPFAANEVRGIIQRLDMPLKLSFLGFEEHHISQLINSLDEHTLATEAPIPTDSDSLEKLLKASL